MSLELSLAERIKLTESFRHDFPPLPLLQGNQLKPAPEIDIDKISATDQPERMRLLGECMSDGYSNLLAVAYTEMIPQVLTHFGIEGNLTNAIYFSQNEENDAPYFYREQMPVNLAGSLFLNPKITSTSDYYKNVRMEWCGSINFGQLSMLCLRPVHITMEAEVYNPACGFDRPTHVRGISSTIEGIGSMTHEYDHLKGFDATNAPGCRIMDPFTDGPEWQKYKRKEWLRYLWSIKLLSGIKEEILVRQDDNLIVVDYRGKKLRDFQY